MLKTPSVIRSLRVRGRQASKERARGVDVLVREDLDFRTAQAAPVDDARVIERVGDHDVVLAENRRDRARVGGEAALKHDDRFGLLEFGEPALQFHVQVERAGDRPHRSGADAVAAYRFDGGVPQPWMCRQAQVVVRRQVHHRAMVDGGLCLLLAREHPQGPVQALFLDGLELFRQIAKGIGAHGTRQYMADDCLLRRETYRAGGCAASVETDAMSTT